MVLTYSEKMAQYSLSEPKDRRMKKAPDIRSISPTTFIPMKSAGKVLFIPRANSCGVWLNKLLFFVFTHSSSDDR